MELLYYWIDRYRKIKEQEFNFGGEYIFEYKKEDRKLIINKNPNYFKGFYNSSNGEAKIVNISAIVGKNGAGKTTVLDALSGLLYDHGILGRKTKDDSEALKRILVASLNDRIRIIFYKSLINTIVFGDKILYGNGQIKNNGYYRFEIIDYDENSMEETRTDLLRAKGSEFIEDVTCIRFSNIFYDNYDSIINNGTEGKSYYDISLTGILKEYEDIYFNKANFIDESIKPSFIKYFHINELIKQIHFIQDKDKYRNNLIHFTIPKQLHIYTDIFILRKNPSISIIEKILRCENSMIEKYESEKRIYNLLNEYIDDLKKGDSKEFDRYIESIEDSEKRKIVKVHFLRRILDDFFENLDNKLSQDSSRKILREKDLKIDYNSLNNIVDIITKFSDMVIDSIEDLEKDLNKCNKRLISDMFKEFITLYKNFICEFCKFIELENIEFKLEPSSSKEKRQKDLVFNENTERYEYNEQAITIVTMADLQGYIVLKTDKENLGRIKSLLDTYKNLPSKEKFLIFDWQGISSGEYALLSFYSRFNHLALNHKINDNVVILLDEPTTYFHPEWERKFLDIMIEFIPQIIKCKTIQIIFTTNNPMTLTDIVKTNIIYLKKSDKKENGNEDNIEVIDNLTKKQTFGANIHTLFTDSFFLETTIGEFALKKIKAVIKDLTSDKEIDKERKKEIEYIINNIGEYIIKSKLERLYYNKFPEEKENYRIKIQQLMDERDRLQKMIELKGIDNIDNVMKLLSEQIKELKRKAGICDDSD